eukprot:jgi/Tetstr1/422713/TSEL_013510.t1
MVEARCRDEFLFDVRETRKEMHAEGQNRSRDILVARLKLALQPEESPPSPAQGYSYLYSREESKQELWWKRPNGTLIRPSFAARTSLLRCEALYAAWLAGYVASRDGEGQWKQ